MAKNLTGISLKGLTATQKRQMSAHKTHHTKAHLRKMATEMRKGKSFKQSHNIAMRSVGR
tara:strand:+ start:223 stop:402 length:180 start_codon:yes stop_codon:yes gene_type:complete